MTQFKFSDVCVHNITIRSASLRKRKQCIFHFISDRYPITTNCTHETKQQNMHSFFTFHRSRPSST